MNDRKLAALVIGNQEYKEWTELSAAGNDAHRIASILMRAGCDVVNVRLTNISSTEIFEHLARLREKAYDSPKIFYFSGHGYFHSGNDYLVLTNTRKWDVHGDNHRQTLKSSISIREICDIVVSPDEENPADDDFLYIIIDACRSNAPGLAAGTKPYEPYHSNQRACAFFSAEAGAVSYSADKSNCSVFTEILRKNWKSLSPTFLPAFAQRQSQQSTPRGNIREGLRSHSIHSFRLRSEI